MSSDILRDIMSVYIVDRFTIGRFYSVIDYYTHEHPFHTIENRLTRKYYINRGKYCIGQIIDKKCTKDITNYLISYKDWPSCFNEWVPKTQLFKLKQNYIHTINVHAHVDSYNHINNKWYAGIITKINVRTRTKIFSPLENTYTCIDTIDVLSWNVLTKTFMYRRNIPLYSNYFAKFGTHICRRRERTPKPVKWFLQALQIFTTQTKIPLEQYIEFKIEHKLAKITFGFKKKLK